MAGIDPRDPSPFLIENPNPSRNVSNNGTSSTDFDDSWFSFGNWYFFIAGVIELALALGDLVALTFLVCMILKHKRLRIRPNYYIMNIAIGLILYYISKPILFLTNDAAFGLGFSHELHCYFIFIYETGLFLAIVFAAALGLDWYLVTYSPRIVHLHKKLYGYAIGLVYGFVVVRYFIITTSTCIFKAINHVHYLIITSYILIILFSIGLNYLRNKRKKVIGAGEGRRTRYSISAANLVVFSWAPFFFYSVLAYNVSRSITVLRVLYCLEVIPQFIADSCGIVLVLMLGRWDKFFKTAYHNAFKKSSNYEQEDLDTVSDEDEESQQLNATTHELGRNNLSGDTEELIY